MPWTFAHPAAVLPLRRYCPRPLNFCALVIGSMIPDLGYHSRMRDLARFAHSFEGSLLVCLPAGLLLLGAVYLLRKPLCHLLPQPHRSAFAPMAAANPSLSPGVALAAATSVLLGAWTHIAWDALTHRSGWIALRVPLLQEPVFALGGLEFPVYHVLQHISTYLGVAAIAVAYWRWLHRGPNVAAPPYLQGGDTWRYLLLAAFAVGAICIAVILGMGAAARFQGLFAWRVFLFRGLVDGATTFVLLYLLGSVLCYARRPTA